MFDSFKEGNLADCGRWHSIVLLLESDFLESHSFVCLLVNALKDNTIGTFSQLVNLCVAI
jgi:hypothetical protein